MFNEKVKDFPYLNIMQSCMDLPGTMVHTLKIITLPAIKSSEPCISLKVWGILDSVTFVSVRLAVTSAQSWLFPPYAAIYRFRSDRNNFPSLWKYRFFLCYSPLPFLVRLHTNFTFCYLAMLFSLIGEWCKHRDLRFVALRSRFIDGGE